MAAGYAWARQPGLDVDTPTAKCSLCYVHTDVIPLLKGIDQPLDSKLITLAPSTWKGQWHIFGIWVCLSQSLSLDYYPRTYRMSDPLT